MNNKLAQRMNDKSTYSGADWIKASFFRNTDKTMSELGDNVANLLGELFCGIYHLDHKALARTDWTNDRFIEFSLGWHDLSTIDFDELTRLVFLAHHMAIRVNIEASRNRYMRLLFHQRSRNGSLSQRHPTLDEAVSRFKATVSFSEYTDTATSEVEQS